MEVKSPNNLPPDPDRGPEPRPRPDPSPGGCAAEVSGGRLLLRDGPTTFPQLIDQRVRSHGERIFLPRRRARVVSPVTFRRLVTDLREVAAGLMALGLERGDRVGLLAENRCEWLLADLGTTYFGGVDVPRGSDTSPAEMVFILRHAGCRAAFVEDDATATVLLEHQDELPDLEHIIVLADSTTQPTVLPMPKLRDRGRALLAAEPERLDRAAAAVRPDDLLTIVYTSGTTADPKGVMLTHSNVLSNVQAVCEVLHITANDMFLSVLPAWHMYERIMDYLALAAGGQLVYTDRRHIKEDLMAVAPTVFAAVPRIWEMIHDGIVAAADKQRGLGGRLFRRVLTLCRDVGGRRASFVGRLQHRVFGALVLPKLMAITGGRLRLAVSGGGALPRHVDETLLGIGLPLLNGYGLTETSPVAAVRQPERNYPGTIGPPIPATEIQIRDLEGRLLPCGATGVLWIRGPQVMRGYYNNDVKTSEVLDAEGWLNSGDLGHVDAAGHVWITGRAKDTIVLCGGENVEPEPIETAIKTSSCIEQAVCLGQDQKAISALIVPHLECLEQRVPPAQWGERDGVLRGKAVLDFVRKELDRLVRRETGFRPSDRIATFRVVKEPLTIDNGCLTHTLKVRRHVVLERYKPIIDEMLGGAR